MGQIKNSKKLGIGSISFLLSIFGGMFSFTAWDNKYFGEHILSALNISFSYPQISLVILFISFFIGYRYRNDYFAKLGIVISVIFISLIFFLTLNQVFFYSFWKIN